MGELGPVNMQQAFLEHEICWTRNPWKTGHNSGMEGIGDSFISSSSFSMGNSFSAGGILDPNCCLGITKVV